MATRYVPDRALPPYAFLPGRAPHPTRDPHGHSYAAGVEPASPHLPAERWRENEPYLWGVDLFNAGYFWEAHEAWEGLWNTAETDPQQHQFLQGLIQCAAACVKAALGEPASVAKLVQRGSERLEQVPARFMGCDVHALVAAFRAFVAGGADPKQVPSISLS